MENRYALDATLRQRPLTDWKTDFWPAFGLTVITCGIYGFFVLYKLLERRQQHFERMVSMRYYLIQFLKEKAQAAGKSEEVERELSQLEGLHLMASNRDRSGEKSPVLWLVIYFVANIVSFYIFYFLNDDFRIHEANEFNFMCQASEIMQRLGMTSQPILPRMVVPERNFVTFLVLSIVTCGIYTIYWWYTLIEDPNRHFDNHGLWESQLAAVVAA